MGELVQVLVFVVIAVIIGIASKVKEASDEAKRQDREREQALKGGRSASAASGDGDKMGPLQAYLEGLQKKQAPPKGPPAAAPPVPVPVMEPEPPARDVLGNEVKEPSMPSVFDRDAGTGADPMVGLRYKRKWPNPRSSRAKREDARKRADAARREREGRRKAPSEKGGRRRIARSPGPEAPRPVPRGAGLTLKALRSGARLTSEQLRTAYALKEILGPPRALKSYDGGGYEG